MASHNGGFRFYLLALTNDCAVNSCMEATPACHIHSIIDQMVQQNGSEVIFPLFLLIPALTFPALFDVWKKATVFLNAFCSLSYLYMLKYTTKGIIVKT